MAERDLQRDCLDAIKGRDDVWVLNTHGNPVQKGGVPDLLLCVRGRFCGVELKPPNGSYDLTGRQRVTLRLIERAGGATTVVRSVEAFLEFLADVEGVT